MIEVNGIKFLEFAISQFLENKGTPIVDCLVNIGFSSSRGEAKRSIEQGSVKIGERKIVSPRARIFNFTDCMFLVDVDREGSFNVITKF